MLQKYTVYFTLAGAVIWMLIVLVLSTAGEDKPETYTNPVLVETVAIKRKHPDNFNGLLGIGDPTVLFYAGKYYLYPTGDNHGYDVYISDDLVTWRKGNRIFRSEEPGVWAPDVFFDETGHKFYLYYTVNGRIGAAVSDRPDGMFNDLGTLIENAIDAHMFRDDDGSYYLYYVEYPGFRINVQPMASLLEKKGNPVTIIEAADPWERKQAAITEAPWMLKHQSVYYLLYSASGADSQDYAIGYATAGSPTGPFAKYRGNPIAKKGGNIFGPGHCSVTKTPDGQLWMIYHQQKDGSRGWNRIICIDPLWFDEKNILRVKPTRGTPRPVPGRPQNLE